MITTIADPYLAQNAGRRYPLADDTPYDDVPCDSAILDFRCTVFGMPSGKALRAWLNHVETVSSGRQLTVSVRDGEDEVDSLTFEIAAPLPESAAHGHTAVARGARSLGEITVSPAIMDEDCVPDGDKSSPFAWTTVVCDSLKVMSVQSGNTAGDAFDEDDPPERVNACTAVLSGEIWLAEGRNADPYLDGNHLRLDIYKGAGLGERCQAAAAGDQTCDTVLFTINGERPGSDGDIRIVGDGGITVTPRPDDNAVEIGIGSAALDRLAKECERACDAV